MKTLSKLIVVASILFVTASANAETPHGHDHNASIGGPKGGRLLENTQPHAELFVEKNRTIIITFYDEGLKPVAAAQQNVSVIAEANGKKTTLDFVKKGDVLVSKEALPEERELNLVVRFRQIPDDKVRNFRFAYEDRTCADCKRAEYACVCGH